jgi:parallel beta-helix repeat protein
MKRISSLLVVCAAAAAFAQDHARPVAAGGPIDSPGNYVLVKDVNSLVISANDVRLNLNGYSVNGPGGNSGTGIAIRGARGVEVFGGSLSNFAFGVTVENSANVILRNLRIRAQGLAIPAPPPETGIMIVQSSNVVVEGNALYNVGLGIFVRGGMSRGNRIANNTVTAGTNGALGICYNPAPNDPLGPRGDLVYNNLVSGFNNAVALSDMSVANVFRENTLIYRTTAFASPNASNMDSNNTKVMLP